MTQVILRNPKPFKRRYTMHDIHRLVCRHQKEWQKRVPRLQRLKHSPDASTVTIVAWNYYVDGWSPYLGKEDLQTLGWILGIKPYR